MPFSTSEYRLILQNRRKDDLLSSNIKELECAIRENNLEQNHETPLGEIAQLKDNNEQQQHNVDFIKKVLNCI